MSMNRGHRHKTIHPADSRRGLTLIELLVVIGIIGLLAMLMLPMRRMSREAARRANCSSNMRNVSMAVHAYSAQNGDAMPVGIYKSSRYSAQSVILSQLELSGVQKIFVTFTSTADASSPATSKCYPVYNCPSDNPSGTYASPGGGKYARSNFVFCFGADTLEPPSQQDRGVLRVGTTASFADMAADGASNTVMLSEIISGKTATDPSGAWGYGEAGSCGYTHKNLPQSGTGILPTTANSATDFSNAVATASSMHPGLVNVMYADNHGAQISTSIDPAIWRSMATVNGGEKFHTP